MRRNNPEAIKARIEEILKPKYVAEQWSKEWVEERTANPRPRYEFDRLSPAGATVVAGIEFKNAQRLCNADLSKLVDDVRFAFDPHETPNIGFFDDGAEH
jgi:hypothetical protein